MVSLSSDHCGQLSQAHWLRIKGTNKRITSSTIIIAQIRGMGNQLKGLSLLSSWMGYCCNWFGTDVIDKEIFMRLWQTWKSGILMTLNMGT